jgi:hypothetical protein
MTPNTGIGLALLALAILTPADGEHYLCDDGQLDLVPLAYCYRGSEVVQPRIDQKGTERFFPRDLPGVQPKPR